MNQRVAKRYAKAFLDHATEAGFLNELHSDFETLYTLLLDSSEFKEFIENPLVSSIHRKEILKKVIGSHLSEATLNCLFFLEEKKRVNILLPLIESFFSLFNEQEGIIKAQITSSLLMERQQQTALIQHLKLKFRKDIKAEFLTDQSLIGGIRVRIADKIYDHSFKAQLEEFEKIN